MMQQAVDEGTRVLEVRETAIRIIRGANVRAHDVGGAVRALFRFVRDRIYFVHDPVGTQLVQGAAYTLRVGAGNCAQKAVLLASMLRSIGVPSSFRAIGANPAFPGSFSHVYVVARVGSREVPLDPTYSNNAMGWQFPRPSRTLEVPA